MQDIISSGDWLPYTFAGLMGLAILIYAVLDGYDLGVGILSDSANEKEKDRMIASIGPFWDANETWLVLGVGLMLVAFPSAHGVVLTELYLPVAVMLFGLIFRGVAFDFRAKVPYQKKWRWNLAFYFGSLLSALSQGYMLGAYIMGFEDSPLAILFSILTALAVTSGYCLIGACWLIMKCDGGLQRKAIKWAKYHLMNTVVGLGLISLTTPLVSERIYNKWVSFPEVFWLAPIPLVTVGLIVFLTIILRKMPLQNDRFCWAPLIATAGIFILSFMGLAYSFFPYIIPNQMTIVEAASAPSSLMIMLVGALIVLPILIGYTILAYVIFHGKAKDLSYS
jgi:cytochrome d ubiquinol oxidase subunit II